MLQVGDKIIVRPKHWLKADDRGSVIEVDPDWYGPNKYRVEFPDGAKIWMDPLDMILQEKADA